MKSIVMFLTLNIVFLYNSFAQGVTTPIGGLNRRLFTPQEVQLPDSKSALEPETSTPDSAATMKEQIENLKKAVTLYYYPVKQRENVISVIDNLKSKNDTLGSLSEFISKIVNELSKKKLVKNVTKSSWKKNESQLLALNNESNNFNNFAKYFFYKENNNSPFAIPPSVKTRNSIYLKLSYAATSAYLDNKGEEVLKLSSEDFDNKKRQLQHDLDNNTINFDEFEAKLNIIDNNRESISKQVDKYFDIASALKYKIKTLQNLRVIPAQTAQEAELYYEGQLSNKGFKVLRSALLSYSFSGKASLFSELYSDYFGPIRLAIGTQIASKSQLKKDASGNVIPVNDSEKQQESIQRILGGGGNFIFNFGYPLFAYKNNYETFGLSGAFQPKFSLDVPRLGTDTTDVNYNTDIGIDIGVYGLGFKSTLVPFFTHRTGYIFGNQKFYDYLGKSGTNRSFILCQSTIGIAINSIVRLGVNFNWGDPFVLNNFPTTISLTIIPDN